MDGDLDTLRDTVERLEGRVRALEDHNAVLAVLAHYGFAVDVGDPDATADLYTVDAVVDLGVGSRFAGREGVRNLVLDERHQAIVDRCAHTLGPLVVDVRGDRATATGYVRVYVREGDVNDLWRLSFTRLELVRDGGRWRIDRRTSRPVGDDEAPDILRRALPSRAV